MTDVAAATEVKLFNRWSFNDVRCSDISLVDYIAVKQTDAKFLPHSAGRYAAKLFRKAQCPIVERMTNSLMMHGRNNGKKLMAVRIVKHAFEIIHLLTDKNPIQIAVDAIVKPSMSLPFVVSTKPSISSPLVLVKLPSATSRPLLSASLTSLSTPPRDPPTPTPSRRRMSSSVLPSPTGKCTNSSLFFGSFHCLHICVLSCLGKPAFFI